MGRMGVAFNAMAKDLAATHVSRDYLDKIINVMFNGLIVLNPYGTIVMANTALLDMLGYESSDLVGRPINFLFVEKRLQEQVLAGTVRNQEWLYLAKNGVTVPVLLSASLMKDKDSGSLGVVCVVQDIRQRKEAEEKLRMFTLELERSNHELEEFAYVASHDLREPLRMVASYVQLLQRRYQDKLDKDASDFIGFAVDGVDRMQKLIDALLMYSRIGRNKKPTRVVNCESALRIALANLQVAIEDARGQVTHDPLPAVIGEEVLFVQLFQNLVGNALKFRGANDAAVHISARDQEREWFFCVQDNGIGIDPQYKDKVFVIFQRLHSRDEYAGTGIGLAVCKKIVEFHGGRIWVESQVGQGAAFYFTIPKKGGGLL